ncbi:MAG: V-type ATP synthase subunit I [Phycisphaerae bacterium]
MIAPMKKVYVAACRRDRDALLQAVRELGMVHVEPVDPDRAVADEQTSQRLDMLNRAAVVLDNVEPTGNAPDISPEDAAAEVMSIDRANTERNTRLVALHRQIEELRIWGDVTLDQLDAIEQSGLALHFVELPAEQVDQLEGQCVQPLEGDEVRGEVLVAVVTNADRTPELPDDAQLLEKPPRDRPSIRAEAAEIDEAMKQDARRLGELANLKDSIRERAFEAEQSAEFVATERSGIDHEAIYAIQGWVPAAEVDRLSDDLSARDVNAGVCVMDPEEDEQPPTLIRYPRWARPIRSLLNMLGTNPGYREFDPSPFFMLAMPIFTAMLVGDAGYGLIFTIIGLLAYGKLARSGNKETGQLVVIFSLTTVLWGVLTGNAFGVGPGQMMGAGGLWAAMGGAWQHIAVWWRPEAQAEEGRNLIMQISFIIGCVHLVLAHLKQAIMILPDQRGIAEIGWIGFIFGMFTLVWLMFFPEAKLFPGMVTLWILLGSFALIALFTSPSRNPLKRVGMGILGNLMGIPGAFGDMLSYIRLMAVGLASYYIASAFNDLAVGMLDASMWALPATILVLVLAHSLNIALCLIAIFAHGVRLNMLEFSMNAGVQWAGYPYAPFSLKTASNQGDQ